MLELIRIDFIIFVAFWGTSKLQLATCTSIAVLRRLMQFGSQKSLG